MAMALPSEVILPLASPAPTVLDSDNSDDESQGESGSQGVVVGETVPEEYWRLGV